MCLATAITAVDRTPGVRPEHRDRGVRWLRRRGGDDQPDRGAPPAHGLGIVEYLRLGDRCDDDLGSAAARGQQPGDDERSDRGDREEPRGDRDRPGSARSPACSGGTRVGSIGNGSANTLRFNAITAGDTGLAVANIAYVNGDATTRSATLVVDGQAPTAVAFPPTGSWTTPGTISVIVSLRAGTGNAMTFANASTWAPDIDAIAVSPLPGARGFALTGTQSSRCLDMNNNTILNGTQAQLWDCTGGTNQTWVYTASKQLVVYGNKCLDANHAGTTNGTAVIIWDCNGQTNQQWNLNSNGTITGVQSGLCLDASGAGTANGTRIILWACGTGANQLWTPD